MSAKSNKQLLFEVQLDWLTARKGILSAKDAEGTLQVATPPQFGGEGRPWTPEHFFLGAISSCFMTTYLAFAQKSGFEISNLECDITGMVEIVNGKYKFTDINLYPKIYIPDESLLGKAFDVLEKAHKYCLITNSVNANVFYHSEVLIVHPEDAKLVTSE